MIYALRFWDGSPTFCLFPVGFTQSAKKGRHRRKAWSQPCAFCLPFLAPLRNAATEPPSRFNSSSETPICAEMTKLTPILTPGPLLACWEVVFGLQNHWQHIAGISRAGEIANQLERGVPRVGLWVPLRRAGAFNWLSCAPCCRVGGQNVFTSWLGSMPASVG